MRKIFEKEIKILFMQAIVALCIGAFVHIKRNGEVSYLDKVYAVFFFIVLLTAALRAFWKILDLISDAE